MYGSVLREITEICVIIAVVFFNFGFIEKYEDIGRNVIIYRTRRTTNTSVETTRDRQIDTFRAIPYGRWNVFGLNVRLKYVSG